ncbi:MAG: glycosyltransferase family 2 protein [bacterium]
MKLTILIPAYNEEKNIRDVILSIPKTFDKIDEKVVIVVNDGSKDNTLSQLSDIDVIIINHKKNLGLGKSFQDGLKKAIELNADILVNIDSDGQFNPCDISKLISPIINNEADFVTASRFIDKKNILEMPKIKYYGNCLMSKLVSWILQQKYSDVSCGFRAYNKETMLRLNLFGAYTYTQETFLDLGYKGLSILEIPIKVKYFKDRKSRVAGNLFKYAWKTLKIIFRAILNYRPLKFFGYIGSSLFITGIFLNSSLLIYYSQTKSFTPYKVIGFVGIFLNILGIFFISLGLIADMLYRIKMNQEEILYKLKKAKF